MPDRRLAPAMTSDGPGLDVIVVGGLNGDFTIRGEQLPRPGETAEGKDLEVGAGGKGANQAVAAARLGARVAMVGRVGRDERGGRLQQALNEAGVESAIELGDEPTGAALVQVGPSGEKQILTAPGGNRAVSVDQVRRAEPLIRDARVLLVQLEIPLAPVREALRIARQHGVRTVLDPAPPRSLDRDFLGLVDVLKPNASEARALTGVEVRDVDSARDAASRLLDVGAGAVVVEVPGAGNLVVSAEEEHLVENFQVDTVDRTGAGDALAAGLAVGLARDLPLRDAATLAAAAAALATTAVGAQTGLPGNNAVEELLAQTGRSLH